jgi:hypothetical protein
MVLTGVTLSGNQTNNGGGGINNVGKLTLIDCTVANNIALAGGGIDSNGDLTLLDSTISGNTAEGAGGLEDLGGIVVVANSIIAGNSDDDNYVDEEDVVSMASVDSLGFNLIGDTSASTGWIATDLTGTTAKPLNPKLAPLANNGGPTQTLLPESGSPAINHGSNALVPQGLTTDQRGLPRIVGPQQGT